jgi:Yip1 domain
MEDENYTHVIDEIEGKPQMSEVGTLAGIFVEPGNTFQSMIKKPKFIMAGLLTILFLMAFQVSFIQKVGFNNVVKSEINGNPMMENIPKEQKEEIIRNGSSSASQYIRYAITPIFLAISFLIGGLIYWLMGNAFGGTMTFMRGMSVWVYSSFPPIIVFMVANMIVLLIKSAEDIEPLAGQKGLIHANPAMFLDGKAMPVLATLLGSIDLFQIWGLVLAAIGLKVMGSLSNMSAWTIVMIFWLIVLIVKVLGSIFLGVQV